MIFSAQGRSYALCIEEAVGSLQGSPNSWGEPLE
jgi:hypothetical protein